MELKIMQKTYDLALYLYPALRQFPKSEKHTMAAEIKKTLFRIMRLITRANKARRKRELLAELDAELELLQQLQAANCHLWPRWLVCAPVTRG